MSSQIAKTGILTSGGDALKLNTTIRSFVRSVEFNNIEIIGIQRGGKPSSFDRILASQLGMAALEALKLKKYNTLAGLVNNDLTNSPISDIINATNNLSNNLYRLNKIILR